MNHKTAGLYVNLAKALNALDEAGEFLDHADTVTGDSGSVEYDWEDGRWVVVQA